jgi:hypothetical protein
MLSINKLPPTDKTPYVEVSKELLEVWLGRKVFLDDTGKPVINPDEEIVIELCGIFKSAVIDRDMIDVVAEAESIIETITKMAAKQNAAPKVRAALMRYRGEIGRLMRLNEIAGQTRAELETFFSLPLVLQKPEGSLLHKAREACRDGSIFCPAKDGLRNALEGGAPINELLDHEHHSLVIEHDWAAAFKNAADFEGGEIKLPFDLCFFEFRISGYPVAAATLESEDERSMILMMRIPSGWAVLWFYHLDDNFHAIPTHRSEWVKESLKDGVVGAFQPLADLVAKNIRAVAIALDAEVAETATIRAPHKLNAARAKRGKLPLTDYHIVSLSRRSRAPSLPRDPNAEPGTPRRLHFRRGHWRHYANHKTWIKWMLVGNPDLGFVDKHYKL